MTSDPSLIMALLWLVFIAAHVGPAVSGLRERVTARFGKLAWVVGFSLVAQAIFAAMAIYFATHVNLGVAGPALGSMTGVREALIAVSVVGLVLVVGACAPAQYVSSAMNGFLASVRSPYGLERVTRHPFSVGLTLWGGAHSLLSSHLIGTIFFGGFGLLGTFGTLHQERKLLRERGAPFEQYLQTTSFVPFLAILTGRQQLAAREQPWGFLALGAATAVGLRALHPGLLLWDGAAFALVFAVTTSYFVFASYRNHLRAQAQAVGKAAGGS